MSSVINLIIVWTLRNSPYWKGNSDDYIRQIPLAHMLFRTLPHGLLLLLFYTQVGSKQFTYCWSQAGFRKGRGTRDQIANICWIIEKAREFQKNFYFCFIDYAKAVDCVDHNKLWKILKEMGIPDHLTCLLRNLYAGQEATVRTGHGTTDWLQMGKGVYQGCI